MEIYSVIEEEWRPIPSLDGWYDASSQGGIRSWKVGGRSKARRSSPLVMKPTLGPGDRYWYIMAHARGTKRRNRLVQQLVAEAFLGPAEGRIVRHLNNVGTDNRLENLAYGSNSENQMDRVLHGTSNRGTASGHNKLSEEDVMSVLELRKKGLPMQRIATEVGCSRKNVHKILVGETWSWLTGIQPQ